MINILSLLVHIHMPIIKFLYLTKTTIILKNFNYFLCYEFKNRLRNFQPENGQKFKNKPGCSKIVVLIRKKSVHRLPHTRVHAHTQIRRQSERRCACRDARGRILLWSTSLLLNVIDVCRIHLS